MTLLSQIDSANIENQLLLVQTISTTVAEKEIPPVDQLVAIATYLAIIAEASPDPEGLLMMFVDQVEAARGAPKQIFDQLAGKTCTKCGKCGKQFSKDGVQTSESTQSEKQEFNRVINEALAFGVFNTPKKIKA